MRLDEVSLETRLERRTTHDTSPRHIMRLCALRRETDEERKKVRQCYKNSSGYTIKIYSKVSGDTLNLFLKEGSITVLVSVCLLVSVYKLIGTLLVYVAFCTHDC